MMFTVAEIAEATAGIVTGPGEEGVEGVSTDSRTVTPGKLFVPLKGTRFDGHDYLPAVAAAGVRVALVGADRQSSAILPNYFTCIVVDDTLKALGDLAAWHRRRFDIPLVGVTGSNGKTTTKEMLASILEGRGPGLKTAGNLNNLIGLPQMLFQLDASHCWAVMEMGMSEPGEIDRLAEIAAPAVGIITNVFPAHLESMGTLEAIARAKGELFMRLGTGGFAVYNADDPLVSALPVPSAVTRVSFGLHGAEVTAEKLENMGIDGQRFVLRLPGSENRINLHAYGRHNVQNALAAAASAWALGVSVAEIVAGLERFRPVDKRFNLERIQGITLIDDSYNANPGSMAAALVTLSELASSGRAIAVIGDMLELGRGAMEGHREVGRLAATCVSRLYLMGRFAETVKLGALEGGMAEESVLVADEHGQILSDLRGTLQSGDYVLVKGSRGMKMEVVAEGIRTWSATTAWRGGN